MTRKHKKYDFSFEYYLVFVEKLSSQKKGFMPSAKGG